MRRLTLPVIKGHTRRPSALSMDAYLRFVQFNLRHTVNKRTQALRKKLLAVDEPFAIR